MLIACLLKFDNSSEEVITGGNAKVNSVDGISYLLLKIYVTIVVNECLISGGSNRFSDQQTRRLISFGLVQSGVVLFCLCSRMKYEEQSGMYHRALLFTFSALPLLRPLVDTTVRALAF